MINISYVKFLSWWSFNKRLKAYQRSVSDQKRNDGKINSYSSFHCYKLQSDIESHQTIKKYYKTFNNDCYNKQKKDII